MKNLFFSGIVFFSLLSQAQVTIDQTKNDNDLKLSALPYYSFGKGVGITSPDSLYQFNIRMRLQNRVTYTNNEDENGTYDGQIRRLRLRFDAM
jgi:phosphate-selective porin OprO and OprP